MESVVLTLTSADGTSIVFEASEVPEHIPFGGDQMVAVHQFVGGKRQVDTLGPSDAPITWSGIFFGPIAQYRARYLDTLRRNGQPVTITWGQWRYIGVISKFIGTIRQPWNIPYTITVIVQQDEVRPIPTAVTSLVQAMADDYEGASCLSSAIGDSELTSLMGSISSGIDTFTQAVNSFTAPIAAASACITQAVQTVQATLQALIAPIARAQARVQSLISSVDSAVGLLSTVGTASTSPPLEAQALLAGSNTVSTAQPLYALSGVLGRMGANAAKTPRNSAKSVTVVGGTLYGLAAQHYGDASQWGVIAQANGLTDPVIQGVQTLTIPNQALG